MSPVFTDSPHTLTSGLRKALRGTRFELPGFGYHSLRHSAASRLLAQGVPITVVSALLGHATPATMLKVYSHAFGGGLGVRCAAAKQELIARGVPSGHFVLLMQ
jgi:integrase